MDSSKRKKTGGRRAGTPNKATADLRKAVGELLDKNWGKIQKDLRSVHPKDRLDFMEKMLSYCLPKLQSTNIQGDLTARIGALTDEQLSQLIERIIESEPPTRAENQ